MKRNRNRTEYMRKYRAEHADELADYMKNYIAENSAHLAEYKRHWQAQNPDKRRAKDQRRRGRKVEAGGTFTDADIQRIYNRQEGLCAYCHAPLNGVYHIDHIQPLSRGGSNWPENLACACAYCNQSKGAKTLDEWLS